MTKSEQNVIHNQEMGVCDCCGEVIALRMALQALIVEMEQAEHESNYLLPEVAKTTLKWYARDWVAKLKTLVKR